MYIVYIIVKDSPFDEMTPTWKVFNRQYRPLISSHTLIKTKRALKLILFKTPLYDAALLDYFAASAPPQPLLQSQNGLYEGGQPTYSFAQAWEARLAEIKFHA